MRHLDDFLFISSSKHLSESFYSIINEEEFNFAENKTKISFQPKTNITGFEHETIKWIPWCGLQLNVKTLDWRCRYNLRERYTLKHSFKAISFYEHYPTLMNKMERFLNFKRGPLLFDTNINGHLQCLINLYDLFIDCARHFHMFTKYLEIDNMKFIQNALLKLEKFCWRGFEQQKKKFQQEHNLIVKYVMNRKEHLWLWLHSFFSLFQCHPKYLYSKKKILLWIKNKKNTLFYGKINEQVLKSVKNKYRPETWIFKTNEEIKLSLK